jgi:hypothetical protein
VAARGQRDEHMRGGETIPREGRISGLTRPRETEVDQGGNVRIDTGWAGRLIAVDC